MAHIHKEIQLYKKWWTNAICHYTERSRSVKINEVSQKKGTNAEMSDMWDIIKQHTEIQKWPKSKVYRFNFKFGSDARGPQNTGGKKEIFWW